MKGLWLLLLIGSMFFPNYIYSENIAVVIRPYDFDDPTWTNDLTDRVSSQLEIQGYQVIWIEHSDDIRTLIADRIVLVFVGHSDPDDRDQLWATWGVISLGEVISHLHTPELIMLTSTCGGGHWLTYSEENRIIISAVNDTVAIMQVTYNQGYLITYTPTLSDLLRLTETQPIEVAYLIWQERLFAYYAGVNYSHLTAVMYDGINGDVWI